MIKFYKINYDDLIDNYEKFIFYAINESELFSVITYMKKPYAQDPPILAHSFLETPIFCLKQQIKGIHQWSNNGTDDNHTVMNIYNSNKCSINGIFSLGNFLLSEDNGLPEDICFYKNNTIWISTVSHENLAFLYSTSKKDLDFFEKNNIRYHETLPMKIYKLP